MGDEAPPEGAPDVPPEAPAAEEGPPVEETKAAEEETAQGEEKPAEEVEGEEGQGGGGEDEGGEGAPAEEAAQKDETSPPETKEEGVPDETAAVGEEGEAVGEEEGQGGDATAKADAPADLNKKMSTRSYDLRLSMSSDTRMSRASALDKRMQRSSIKQRVLGSIISVRKSFMDGAGGGARTAKFMNSYKLDSDKPFHIEKVEKILNEVMLEALENLSYDVEKCILQAKWASSTIRAKVKEQEFDRYKIVAIVTIGEKRSQDVFSSMKFLWDPDRDKFATCTINNMSVFAFACCMGFYYE